MQSGHRAVMVTQTQVNHRDEKIRWVPKGADVEAEQYLETVLAEARARKQGLCFRTGGGSDLGMIKLPSDKEDNKPMLVEMLGVPGYWENCDVTGFLENQGWSQLQTLTRKRAQARQFVWVLKGMPPADPLHPQKSTWHYQDKTNPQLSFHVTKAAPKVQKKQEVVKVHPPRRRFHTDRTSKDEIMVAADEAGAPFPGGKHMKTKKLRLRPPPGLTVLTRLKPRLGKKVAALSVTPRLPVKPSLANKPRPRQLPPQLRCNLPNQRDGRQ